MEFLADENVAPRVVNALRAEGLTVWTIQEKSLVSAPDETIVVFSKKKNLIILTHDKDFGNFLHYPLQSHRGVILIRLKNQSPENVIKHLIYFLKKIDLTRIKNRLVIIKEKRVKIF